MKSILYHIRLCCLVGSSVLILSGCVGKTAPSPTPTPTAEPTATAVPTSVPTETSIPSPTATRPPINAADLALTAQAVADQSLVSFPLAWPVEFSDEQIEAAQLCDVWTIIDEFYDETWQIEQLVAAYEPETACDWAELATAYVVHASEHEGPVPEAGKKAYLAAISQNPALVLLTPLLFGYLDEMPLVDPPPFADQPVVTARLDYTFGGIGYQSEYTILITAADTSPIAEVTGTETDSFGEEPEENDLSSYGPISPDLVQALGQSLTDFVPVEELFEVISCYDYYPDWEVTLTFADGTSLQVLTNGSNLLGEGGPWQAEIDGQNYVQVSGAFVDAVAAITGELNLPGGSTAAMACFPPGDLIDLGYPSPNAD